MDQTDDFLLLRKHGHTFGKPFVRSLKLENTNESLKDGIVSKVLKKYIQRSQQFGINKLASGKIKKLVLSELLSIDFTPSNHLCF